MARKTILTDSLAPSDNSDNDQAATQQEDASNERSENQESASSEPRKRRVKIDGEEREVSDDDLVRDYQLKESSYKRMEEASKLAKSVKPFLPVIEAIKNGDLSVLKQLGIPKEALRKFSEKELLEYIEEQEMTPEQRRARDAEMERDMYKADLAKKAEEESKYKQSQNAQKAAQEIEADIVDALKESGISMKDNYRMVRRMAEDMFAALESKETRATAKEARDRVTQGMKLDFEEYVTREFNKDPEKFIDSLPTEFVDGVRKRDLRKVKSQLPIGGFTGEINMTKPRKDDDFRKYMRGELAKRG